MAWSTVDCSEEAGTIRENYSESGFTASVTLRCAWADRHALVASFYSTMPTWPYGGVSAYPISASILPAASVWYESSGQIITNYGDNTALVTVNFSSAQESDLASDSLEPTVDAQILDHKLFMWSVSGDTLLENESPVRLMRGLNLVRTLYKQASIPAAVLNLPGCVNNATYTSSSLGLTFPIETLQFAGVTMNRTITTSGSQGWDITAKFRYQKDGWNKYWHPVTQAWEEIIVKRTGATYKNFPPVSFSGLL